MRLHLDPFQGAGQLPCPKKRVQFECSGFPCRGRQGMARKRLTAEQNHQRVERSGSSTGTGPECRPGMQTAWSDRTELLPVEEGVRGTTVASGQAVEGVGEREHPTRDVGRGSVRITRYSRRHHNALGYRPPVQEAFLLSTQARSSPPWAGLHWIPASNLRAPLLGSPIVGTDYESWVWRLAVC